MLLWKNFQAIKLSSMYLYGASGHAKVIIEILEKNNIPVKGIFDDNKNITALFNYNVNAYPAGFDPLHDKMIISIGNNSIRKQIASSIDVNFETAIHPFTSISSRSKIGAGTVVMAGVTINAEAIIGKHCIVNTNASIDHECIIEDFVNISPNAALCGNVTVGEGTHIGAGTVVIPGVKIGKWCNIGAGSVVIRDVPDNTTAVGNPSRIIKTNSFI